MSDAAFVAVAAAPPFGVCSATAVLATAVESVATTVESAAAG